MIRSINLSIRHCWQHHHTCCNTNTTTTTATFQQKYKHEKFMLSLIAINDMLLNSDI